MTILESLNAYDEDDAANIWRDVIYDVIDIERTSIRWDDSNSDDFIGFDGRHYGYRPSAFVGPWVIVED